MYVGVDDIIYERKFQVKFKNMKWDIGKGPNYADKLSEFIKHSLNGSEFKAAPLINLILFIMENIHDHGSGKCILYSGYLNEKIVFEIFESKGGFDLKKLPNGYGGWGYNSMKKSKWTISHSKDGKRTFIIPPNE